MAPPDWDGHAKLPVLIFLHGYGGEGADVLADADVTGPAGRLGFLLVAPDGLNRSWAHQGSPSQARDDRMFLHSVLAEVKRRWPVDARLMVLGGFSQGASMVWDMACFAPLGFTAFLPFSGGFWERMPTACTAPVNLRHVHGTADRPCRWPGRAIAGRWRQADIGRGFAIWRETDRCATPPERQAQTTGWSARCGPAARGARWNCACIRAGTRWRRPGWRTGCAGRAASWRGKRGVTAQGQGSALDPPQRAARRLARRAVAPLTPLLKKGFQGAMPLGGSRAKPWWGSGQSPDRTKRKFLARIGQNPCLASLHC